MMDHRTADGDVFIPIAPVIWQTLGDTLWSFGNHEEMQVTPSLNYQPCVFAPFISFLNEEIRSKARPHERAGWNLPIPLSVSTYGEIEAGSLRHDIGVFLKLRIAPIHIAVQTALALLMAAVP